ncbi:hypothetical protein [Helicobacter sp. T3_23-1056]
MLRYFGLLRNLSIMIYDLWIATILQFFDKIADSRNDKIMAIYRYKTPKNKILTKLIK